MKIGDLVKMNAGEDWTHGDVWGLGIIVKMQWSWNGEGDIHVLWANVGLSWEMSSMLDKVYESN